MEDLYFETIVTNNTFEFVSLKLAVEDEINKYLKKFSDNFFCV